MRLYHNAISTCSQKVRMVLHEKLLSYDETNIDLMQEEQHSKEYLKINPKAVVPTLIHGNNTITESSLINEYLDDAYPEIPLRPQSAHKRYQMRQLCKRIDDELHIACAIVTFGIVVRPGVSALSDKEIDTMTQKIADKAQREARRDVLKHGLKSDGFTNALQCHLQVFDQAEAMLSDSPWLCGENFSLADCALIPYVLRFDQLGQGNEISKRQHLADWYQNTRHRTAYEAAINQWIPDFMPTIFASAAESAQDELSCLLN